MAGEGYGKERRVPVWIFCPAAPSS